MKMTRKLIPAIAMLLISAVMMSTASFAWFSMNTTVSATGMQIEAKSDQTFLIISTTPAAEGASVAEHAAAIQAEYNNTQKLSVQAVAPANTTVYPAALKEGSGISTNEGNIKFQYAVGAGYDNHLPDSSGYTEVTALADYVVKYTFYLTVVADAVPASDIVVKALTITGDEAVAVVVTTDSALVELQDSLASGTEDTTVLSNGLHKDDGDELKGKLTDEDVLAVHVYVFIDGDDETVTTANAANLNGATIDITFGVKKKTN